MRCHRSGKLEGRGGGKQGTADVLRLRQRTEDWNVSKVGVGGSNPLARSKIYKKNHRLQQWLFGAAVAYTSFDFPNCKNPVSSGRRALDTKAHFGGAKALPSYDSAQVDPHRAAMVAGAVARSAWAPISNPSCAAYSRTSSWTALGVSAFSASSAVADRAEQRAVGVFAMPGGLEVIVDELVPAGVKRVTTRRRQARRSCRWRSPHD